MFSPPFVFCVSCFVFPSKAKADVTLPALISNNMVIQSHRPIPIWGNASPNEKITLTLAGGGQTKTITANDDGKFKTTLDPLPPSDQPIELTVKASNTLTVKNILVGEVWFCAGQSNMGWQLKASTNGEEEIKNANHPNIRLWVGQRAKKDDPDSLGGSWQPCSPKTAERFSAVAYHFGKHLHRSLKRPIALMDAGAGGSYIEQWLSVETMKTDPTLPDFAAMLEADKLAYEKLEPVYAEKLKKWQATTQAITTTRPELAKAYPGTKGLPYAPKRFMHPDQWYGTFSNLPHRIRRMELAGIAWYQGESQLGYPEPHSRSFPALIKSWRKLFNREDLPILFVQMPNIGDITQNPNTQSKWAELRESQLTALNLPHTAMVVTLDVGEAKNVHPPNKQPVGNRLAYAALATIYKSTTITPWSSPMMDTVTIDGPTVTVKFKHAEGGLTTTDNKPPTAFALAGEDCKYHWATATIKNDTVILTSENVKAPKTVRYAWSNNPQVNLVNPSQLPAAPFRHGEPPPTPPKSYSAWQHYLRN
jgi:sialate O-acetylesterase